MEWLCSADTTTPARGRQAAPTGATPVAYSDQDHATQATNNKRMNNVAISVVLHEALHYAPIMPPACMDATTRTLPAMTMT